MSMRLQVSSDRLCTDLSPARVDSTSERIPVPLTAARAGFEFADIFRSAVRARPGEPFKARSYAISRFLPIS